jgi:hypothetical protein
MCKPKPINPSGCGGINQSAVVAKAPASQFWQHWRKSLKNNLHYMDGSFVSDTATLKPLINNFVQKYVFQFLTAHGTMQSSDQE